MLSERENPTVNHSSRLDGDPAVHSSNGHGLDVDGLRAVVKGQVFLPGEAGYDEARTLFYGGLERQPAVIVQAADAADVARVVRLARDTGLELAVRSGGHSAAGHSTCEGGILIDLKALRDLEIDQENLTAWAGTGLTAGEYSAAAGAHGLATGFGDTGSVGIGGITLGGGVGFLVRKYGLTIDDLLAAEIVTADSQILYVDAENHPDLFWAIRGGGGNFGIATRFKFRLHRVDSIVGGMLILPATVETIARFIAEAEAAPEELTTIANVMTAPAMPFLPEHVHGQMIIFAFLVYAGDTEAGERVIAPFRSLAEPLADMLRPMTYAELIAPEDEDYHPTAVGHTLFVDRIEAAEAETILRYLNESDAVLRVAQLRVLGGAMARVPVDATAFAHRQARIMVNLAAFYTSPEDKLVREAWIREFAGVLAPKGAPAYVNFLGENDAGRIRDAYPGATLSRLEAIKARYDPGNLFHRNHNILPAREGLSSTER